LLFCSAQLLTDTKHRAASLQQQSHLFNLIFLLTVTRHWM